MCVKSIKKVKIVQLGKRTCYCYTEIHELVSRGELSIELLIYDSGARMGCQRAGDTAPGLTAHLTE